MQRLDSYSTQRMCLDYSLMHHTCKKACNHGTSNSKSLGWSLRQLRTVEGQLPDKLSILHI